MSVLSRIQFSFFANLARSAVAFITGIFIARSLGPEQYGAMTFLLATFLASRQLLDMGSSTTFFTLISQKERSRRFIMWYLVWLSIQFIVPLAGITILMPRAWVEVIWRGEQTGLIALAFIAVYSQYILWGAVLQMAESQRLTRMVQTVSLAIAVIHFLLVIFAWHGGWLEVSLVYVAIIIEMLGAVILISTRLKFQATTPQVDAPTAIFSEFWRHSISLVPYAWLGCAYEFVDRWMLQTYGGSIQQAYYSVAYQFGAISALATSSFLNIFWKEVAEAHHQKNINRVRYLYSKTLRSLFFVSAASAGFLVPWAGEILRVVLGPDYVGGVATLTLMFFYPIHQSMGQITGTMAYATGQLSLYARIGMIFMAVSILVTYFILAPDTAALPGADLGSLGLACKMVIMQIVSVNVLAFYLAHRLEIRYDWVFQPITVIITLFIGFSVHFIASPFILGDIIFWPNFILSGLIYLISLILLVVIAPNLIGLERTDIAKVLKSNPFLR